MTRKGSITVAYLGGLGVEAVEAAFRLVHAEVFAQPPYDEGAENACCLHDVMLLHLR